MGASDHPTPPRGGVTDRKKKPFCGGRMWGFISAPLVAKRECGGGLGGDLVWEEVVEQPVTAEHHHVPLLGRRGGG